MDGECSRCPAGISGVAFLTGIRDTGRLVAGIGRLVIDRFMAAKANVGSGSIISVMTGCAIVGDGNMSSCQHVVIAVNRESGRGPAWIGRMAVSAGIGDPDGQVVGVRCLHVNAIMTIAADHSSTLITILMALQAVCGGVGAGEREIGRIMIKSSALAGRVATVTGLAVPAVAADALVFFIHVRLVMFMAVYTAENSVISGCGMTIHTCVPFSLVLTRIDREILPVVIECGWDPGVLGMAGLTIMRKS
jgi:hypothetical protein